MLLIGYITIAFVQNRWLDTSTELPLIKICQISKSDIFNFKIITLLKANKIYFVFCWLF